MGSGFICLTCLNIRVVGNCRDKRPLNLTMMYEMLVSRQYCIQHVNTTFEQCHG